MKLQFNPSRLAALVSTLGLVALLGACASKGTPPVAELATARASITQAESAGALDMAPVELLAARDKFGKAEAALRDERFDEARQLATRAEADADLAQRKARAAKARSAAAELARSNDLLRAELERKTPR